VRFAEIYGAGGRWRHNGGHGFTDSPTNELPGTMTDANPPIGSGLVQAKLELPRHGASHSPRPRVSSLIAESLKAARVLEITATAGSGKTTAVIDAVSTGGSRVSWLTVDGSDVSPGRFLSYLEASLLLADPSIGRAATRALADGIAHPEAAALLAEAVGDRELVVVIDDVERISESLATMEALSGFVRYLPPAARCVLISRRDLPTRFAREELAGEVARLGENDLALTVDEARDLLASVERGDVDAESAVKSTAGWLTGVLFDSWRSARHVHGTGGEADPLRTYLSSEIMDSLPERAQEFLIRTSVLDDVTAARAEALGLHEPAATLALLRERHLPVAFPEPQLMRCHPRLREYLLARLEALEPAVVRATHLAHADLLMKEGREEEAVDEFLRAGDVAQAEDAANAVLLAVVRRLDVDLASRWLAAFRRWRVESSIVMTEAELLVALEREQYGFGAVCADRLLELADVDRQHTIDPALFGAMAWCYFLNGRIEDALSVLEGAIPGPETDVVRFAISVELIDSPVHYCDRPEDTGSEADGMLARIDLAHGRFERILGAASTRLDAVRGARLGALVGLGRLEEALAHLETWGRSPGWTQVRMRAELRAELGRSEEAWAELIAGRSVLAEADSTLYRMFASLTEAMLALRFSRDTAQASAVLAAVEREPTALRRVRVLEQLALWRGLIALIDGDDARAVLQLREAVALMTTWDRLLFLPTAAVYLAEAEWRMHEDDASDAAADLALRSADRTGSRHSLIRALREYPAVLSRRLDTESDPDSSWHDLGRAVVTMTDGLGVIPSVHVTEFGDPGIMIDGRWHKLKLVKSVELMAFLAARGGSAPREDVITCLFDSKNDKAASAYLRMAVNGVRECFPERRCLEIGSDTVDWVQGELESDYTKTRTTLVRLRNVQGRQRLDLALKALAEVPDGEYLPGTRSGWVTDQRRRWNDLLTDIRHDAASAAFEIADYATASTLIDEVIERDQFRERAWRLKMRVAAAVGDGDGVISAFRGCEAALTALKIAPTDSTRQLLQRLRF
jgi:ATP/maltotriose-dependent transcriptional regulator MalT/DNA-binding SARP family transcriptional activator